MRKIAGILRQLKHFLVFSLQELANARLKLRLGLQIIFCQFKLEKGQTITFFFHFDLNIKSWFKTRKSVLKVASLIL